MRFVLAFALLAVSSCGNGTMGNDGGPGGLVGSYAVTITGNLTPCPGMNPPMPIPLSGTGQVMVIANTTYAGGNGLFVIDPNMTTTGGGCTLTATATASGMAVLASGQLCMDAATGTPFMLINGNVTLQGATFTLEAHWQSTATSGPGCETLDELERTSM